MMKYVMYNPLSGKGKGKAVAEKYAAAQSVKTQLLDMTQIKNYAELFKSFEKEDDVVIFGGDGTLNRFANEIADIEIKNNIYYHPSGTGNDFALDVGMADAKEPFLINEYLKNLPFVTVNGTTLHFINGIGYGIDGYCCAVGDKLREENKKIDYTAIAIKGLLFHHKPSNATVVVDGVEHTFEKVWIAPTMIGRHYGGGMMPTPNQKRDSGELSVMLFHGTGRIKTLMIFPSIFKGTHIEHKKNITVLTGKTITVKYDKPTFLQVDGETFYDVTEYTAQI